MITSKSKKDDEQFEKVFFENQIFQSFVQILGAYQSKDNIPKLIFSDGRFWRQDIGLSELISTKKIH
jgi:hypothetical protein